MSDRPHIMPVQPSDPSPSLAPWWGRRRAIAFDFPASLHAVARSVQFVPLSEPDEHTASKLSLGKDLLMGALRTRLGICGINGQVVAQDGPEVQALFGGTARVRTLLHHARIRLNDPTREEVAAWLASVSMRVDGSGAVHTFSVPESLLGELEEAASRSERRELLPARIFSVGFRELEWGDEEAAARSGAESDTAFAGVVTRAGIVEINGEREEAAHVAALFGLHPKLRVLLHRARIAVNDPAEDELEGFLSSPQARKSAPPDVR